MSISLRRSTPADEEFLFAVYASTRADELRWVDWEAAQKEAFLRMQFEAQREHYRLNFPEAEYNLILRGQQPIGRLYLHRGPGEIRILDIALLPGHRRQGVGSLLLKQVLEEGRQSSRPVTIHVERFNPALHLYDRLGFRLLQDHGVYLLLGWSPAGHKAAHHAG